MTCSASGGMIGRLAADEGGVAHQVFGPEVWIATATASCGAVPADGRWWAVEREARRFAELCPDCYRRNARALWPVGERIVG